MCYSPSGTNKLHSAMTLHVIYMLKVMVRFSSLSQYISRYTEQQEMNPNNGSLCIQC